MVKSQIIAKLAEETEGLLLRDAYACVEVILKTIGDAMSEGNAVQLRTFGSFTVNFHPSYMARNPKTGKPVPTVDSYSPHFKPGKQLRERVNQHYGEPLKDDE